MNKYLLGTAAIAGLLLASAPAQAQMELTIGGHSKNYIGFLDQDDTSASEARDFDMIRETELHFNGESTLDNGLTFGFQVETEVDGGDDDNTIEESYIYLSGTWGRVNLGSEDGASYLLQVAAPSADSNIDGIRQYISPLNQTVLAASLGGVTLSDSQAFSTRSGASNEDGFDYDNDLSGVAEKLTYLSPNFNGFQVGASYTPDTEDNGSRSGLEGFNQDDVSTTDGEAYEIAGRYEGVVSNFGYAFGAGYSLVDLEEDSAGGADDITEWNVGLDVDSGPFGLGVVYTELDTDEGDNSDVETFVVGADYTTGPFKFGASYFTQDDETIGAQELETDRYTGGVIYTAGPGLTFRGSVSYIENEVGSEESESTSVLGGIQINF